MLEWKKQNLWKNSSQKKLPIILEVFLMFFLTYIFFVYNLDTFYIKDSGQFVRPTEIIEE